MVALMMVFYWCSTRKQNVEAPMGRQVRFALKEGQTIVGVEDTPQGVAFYIGGYVRDERYYDL
jgi:hypothetical protein